MPNRAVARALLLLLFTFVFASAAMPEEEKVETTPVQEVIDVLGGSTNISTIVQQQFSGTGDGDWQHAIEAERERLLAVLQSRGYLAAAITAADRAVDLASAKNGDVIDLNFEVQPGVLFKIGNVQVLATSEMERLLVGRLDDVVVSAIGDVADDQSIKAMVDRLVWQLGRNGYPSAEVLQVSKELQHETGAATLVVNLDIGNLSYFSGYSVDGESEADDRLVAQLLPFKIGDLYSVDAVAKLRQDLSQLEDVERFRVDVTSDIVGEFALNIEVRKKFKSLPEEVATSLGLIFLLATLIVVAIRQIKISGENRVEVFSLLNVVTAVMLFISFMLAVLRILSFI